jgi:hypothetical protein
MSNYKIISQIRQSVTGDFYLHVKITKGGREIFNMRNLTFEVEQMYTKIYDLVRCGDNYGYSKSFEEAEARKEIVDSIISSYFKTKTINSNFNDYLNVKVSHAFS